MNVLKSKNICLIAMLALVLSSCSASRYLPEGAYLLDEVKVLSEDNSKVVSSLKSKVRQQPNIRTFGLFRLPLAVYNLSGKKDNIVNGAIEYIPTKTKTRRAETVRVPLSEKALNILSRYDLPDGSLLPFISDQRYNDYIKELFKLEEVGLDRLVTRLNPMTLEEEQVPLYEIATSHMARRTFVGTLHKQNVKNEIIASMSGHAKASRAFARYYDIDNETQNEVVKNYLD